MEFQPSPFFLGLNLLGGIIKHIIPGKAINKAIPFINYATAFVARKAMGHTWSGSAIAALYDSGAASVVYESAKQPARRLTGKSI